ncbi:hypothetical protein TWF694_007388 [Orbilia ellipsospora]|uniref:FUN14 family protein n=1 Tax=Orbilia ellipsospora TaxID=2528407 RepID=A0AAV9XHK2_9PEZI
MLLLRPIGLRLAIGISVPSLYLSSHLLYPRRTSIIQCQAAPYLTDRITEARESKSISDQLLHENARTKGGSWFNPYNFRQISTGSFAGVVTGYMIGRWSRMLFFIGILVVMVVQYIERRGYTIIPYQRLDKMAHEADIKQALTKNAAFRWTFATTFALSAWFAN